MASNNDDYPGNISTTGRLTATAPVDGVIDFLGDQDWFKIYLTAGTAYTFNQVQTPQTQIYNLDSYLRLLDSSGGLITADDDGGGNRNARISYTPTVSGEYYLSAEANSWTFFGTLTGSYQLTESANHAPMVIGKEIGAGINQSIAASALFSANDPDGSSIASYGFSDPTGSGYFEWSNGTGVSWNSIDRILTVPASNLGNVTYHVGAGSESIGVTASDGTLWAKWALSTIKNVALKYAADIFEVVGDGVEKGGMIKAMADFAKAAYNLQFWETPAFDGLTHSSSPINDENPTAAAAVEILHDEGWAALDLTLPSLTGSSGVSGWTDTNRMSGGYYTNGNAAAFVALSGDAVVISFRGTNDNGDPGTNALDPTNTIYPDKDQWTNMSKHYALLKPLITALDNYVSTNGISKVYVTGHSMGGAMAIQYMSAPEHDKHQAVTYEAVTFAAPPFTNTTFFLPNRTEYPLDSRVTQIEIAKDPVPMTWDGLGGWGDGFDEIRPGHVIRFAGDETMDAPNQEKLLGPIEFWANDNNHSMDYYLEITKQVDGVSWATILAQSGDQNVLLGAKYDSENSNYTVATGNDTLAGGNFQVYFGGVGKDTLTGGNGSELLLGGVGADTLAGGPGKDSLTGGAGADKFLFDAIADSPAGANRDVITDFSASENDRIDLSSIDANPATSAVDAFSFIIGSSFTDVGQVRFDAATAILYANADTSTSTAEFEIQLIGITDFDRTFIKLTASNDPSAKAVDLLAYSWRTHTLLHGVSITAGAGALAATQTTGTDGSTSFTDIKDSSLALSVERAIPEGESTLTAQAVNLQDAIAILKMIVGLDVNGAGKALSPYQALAADFDVNGQVQLTDAIGVLKHVVGLAAPTPAWHFASETDSSIPQIAGLSPGAAPAISVELSGPTSPVHVGLVAYLSGDVDGSYAGAIKSEDLDDSQPTYFVTLTQGHGLDPVQFGIYS